MSAILFLTGTTRGDALGAITRGVSKAFEPMGYEMIEINLTETGALEKLEKAINQKQILFAFSFAAIGRDINLPGKDGKEDNLWQMVGIPYIAIHGDSPSYFFDRHVNVGPGYATLYGFREHYTMRLKLPKQVGLFGVMPPLMLDAVPESEINFAVKEKGKLIFLKNSNDPKKLKQHWRERCPAKIADMLFEIADVLEANMHTELGTDFDDLVTGLFKNRGMNVDALTNLRLFFDAQLDDYFRRVKCTLMGEVLSEFPVEIHGDNWDYMDFKDKACTFVPVVDYKKSRGLIRDCLGMIDISPNTGGGFHDRLLRSYGMYTLCLTNEQECVKQAFGENSGLTFTFDRDAIREKIADAITRPKDYVELGRVTSQSFRDQFPMQDAARYLLEVADTLKLASAKQGINVQDFFIWPPQSV